MKTILVAQYISGKKKSFVSSTISFYTGLFPCNWGTPPHSHTEICFVERNKCWSSTNRGESIGTRFDTMENVFKHPERWDVFEIQLSERQEECLYSFCILHLDKDYDWVGIAGFALFGINNQNKFYCSEGCGFGLAVIRVINFYRVLSPRHLTKVLLKQGRKMESLVDYQIRTAA